MATPERRVAAVLGAVGALGVVVAAVVAAQGESVILATRPSTQAQTVSWSLPDFQVPPVQTAFEPEDAVTSANTWIHWLLSMLVFAAVVTLIVVVVILLRRRWTAPPTALPRWPDEREPDPARLAAEVATALDRLTDGTPRNAVVSAWVALEAAAEEVGAPRDPAETSSEYVSRVVSRWPVDASAMRTLAALYREARFSEHELTEDDRRKALVALQALRDDLSAVADRMAVTRFTESTPS